MRHRPNSHSPARVLMIELLIVFNNFMSLVLPSCGTCRHKRAKSGSTFVEPHEPGQRQPRERDTRAEGERMVIQVRSD
jgi:hypothetical protein